MCIEMVCRVWDMTNGKQLCSLQGHKGRGVWRCLLHPHQDLLITAGADSSIKLWRLADWLPAHHPLAAQASDAFSLPPLWQKLQMWIVLLNLKPQLGLMPMT